MIAIRTAAGTDLPSASTDLPRGGTWTIDPGHAEVGFVGRHFGLTKIRGRFTGIQGVVTIGDRPADAHVEVTIDMASVNSGDQTRDEHLRSADFFDVEHHPTATYRSTAVAVTGTSGMMDGELTIKGVTRPVRLNVDYLGDVADPWGSDRAVFSARGKLDREEWGLTWNMVLEAGGLLVSKEIVLELEVELVRQPPSQGDHRERPFGRDRHARRVASDGSAVTAAQSPEPPELIGFTLTHSMLRKELTILAGFDPGIGDAASFEDHLRLVTDHLARHDDEEEEFHFRLLRERAPHVSELLDRLTREHAAVTERLRTVRDKTVAAEARVIALRELTDFVLRHIDVEDSEVVPLLQQHITAAEQAGSMARSRSKIPPEDELRVLACMLGAATPDERSRMLAPLPPEVAELWRTTAAPALEAVHAGLGAGAAG